ncbi:transcriptional regulator [Lachnospiraceae bacterium JC7]|nr:transcriptional regulator [Lachnospiraceae bacterium JC7]
MKDSDWRIIYELYQNPSITKIAGMMFKSQSAITKRLQLMEQELDCKIVERSPLGVEFTKEGEFLYHEAVKYLQLEEEVREGLRYIKEQNRENLVIGSAYTYTKYSLYDILDPFSRAHPEANIRVVNKQSNLLHQMLMEGKLDVAFIRSDYTDNVYHDLVDYTEAFVVTKDPVDIQDLPGMDRVAYQTNGKTEEKLALWWHERFGTEFPEAYEDLGYIEFAFRSLTQGNKYLLCFLPDGFVNEYDLCLQPLTMKDGSRVVRKSWFIYRKEKNRRPIVDELIKYVDKNVRLR